MPDRRLTMHAAGEPHQFVLTDTSSGTASAGNVVCLIPDGMTNEALRRALHNLLEISRRNPRQMNGL